MCNPSQRLVFFWQGDILFAVASRLFFGNSHCWCVQRLSNIWSLGFSWAAPIYLYCHSRNVAATCWYCNDNQMNLKQFVCCGFVVVSGCIKLFWHDLFWQTQKLQQNNFFACKKGQTCNEQQWSWKSDFYSQVQGKFNSLTSLSYKASRKPMLNS